MKCVKIITSTQMIFSVPVSAAFMRHSMSIHSQKIVVMTAKSSPIIPPMKKKPNSGCARSCMFMELRCK